jgi:hypothetical protein
LPLDRIGILITVAAFFTLMTITTPIIFFILIINWKNTCDQNTSKVIILRGKHHENKQGFRR